MGFHNYVNEVGTREKIYIDIYILLVGNDKLNN